MEKFEQIAQDIFLLKVPFGQVWTGVTLIMGEEILMIDSGPSEADIDTYVIPALTELGLAPGDIQWLLNTHSHGDHIGGHHRLCQVFSPRVAAFEKAAPKVENPVPYAVQTRSRFPEHSPTASSTLQGVKVDRCLGDGEILGSLRLIHTPGHDDDCVCWYHLPTGTLITGDSLQANGTICQGIGFYKDLPAYRSSLRRLLQVGAEAILCGHDYEGLGWWIQGRNQVVDALNDCAAWVERYDGFLKQYRKAGVTDPVALAEALIDHLGCGRPQRLFMALYTVEQHLNGMKE